VKTVKVLILRTAGTNCDKETKFAFDQVGAEAELVHINQLIAGNKKLADYHIMAIPGGFTYGDDIASGKVLANQLLNKLGESLKEFIKQGKLVIGICNGFQVLVKAGLLGGNDCKIASSLSINDSDKFEDRWVSLKPASSTCIWTKGIKDTIYLPIAHAEGKFIPENKQTLDKLKTTDRIVFRYMNNPNGSVDDIAGICDETGRIFGLMPHPERHFLPYHHPRWQREGLKAEGDGVQIFKNGVEFAKENLV